MKTFVVLALVLVARSVWAADADLSALIADRSAVERVYYNHRLGTKLSFEQTLPPALLEQMVKNDAKKESVLKKVYGVAITPEAVAAEVRRIDTTTRAPEVLAELKSALGDDSARFGRTVARPIIVERELRRRFENDDNLHLAERRRVEQLRNELLVAKQASTAPDKLISLFKSKGKELGVVEETEWQLTPRPKEPEKPDELEVKKKFGPDAQLISPSGGPKDGKAFFEDLQPELRQVLQAQLRQAGDVSAVIEAPTGFMLYVAREKTIASLSVAALALPKRSYESWLEAQRP